MKDNLPSWIFSTLLGLGTLLLVQLLSLDNLSASLTWSIRFLAIAMPLLAWANVETVNLLKYKDPSAKADNITFLGMLGFLFFFAAIVCVFAHFSKVNAVLFLFAALAGDKILKAKKVPTFGD